MEDERNPMVSREVLKMAAKCRQDLDLWRNLVIEGEAAGMGPRDLRDLLMEFGCPDITATELVSGN